MLTSGKIVLVGHPFAPIGRGEDIRCTYRALEIVGLQPGVLDIYRLQKPEGRLQRSIKCNLTDCFGEINIFHLNGNEVSQALAHLEAKDLSSGYNIIYPQWELSNYPEVWARKLDLFDEIWAPSKFVFKAISQVVSKPVSFVPLSCQVELSSMLGRRYFGIPESTYVFLYFFDYRSYSNRKNPTAVIESYERLLQKLPNSKSTLVIKINGGEMESAQVEILKERVRYLRKKVVIINKTISDNEVKNLVRCCDCFISLHRAEGFGRGLAEAMYIGKPVIATGYSGNLDFMNPGNSYLVDYQLIDLNEGEYPYWQGQKWADADVDQAAYFMSRLVSRPLIGYELGTKAALSVFQLVGYRSTGINYLQKISNIEGI